MATKTKTWREKATQKAILAKVNRQRNAVSSLVQLAEEFGAPIHGPYRHTWGHTSGRTASRQFRQHVKETVGTFYYNTIRDGSKVTY